MQSYGEANICLIDVAQKYYILSLSLLIGIGRAVMLRCLILDFKERVIVEYI